MERSIRDNADQRFKDMFTNLTATEASRRANILRMYTCNDILGVESILVSVAAWAENKMSMSTYGWEH